jgi:ribokinase
VAGTQPGPAPTVGATPDAGPALVALLGDLNIDQTLTVPAIPAPGGDAVASSQQTQVGGSATNTAIAVRRLGLRARLIARVGDDPLAAAARRALLAEGVDLGQVSVDPVEPTATNVVLVTPDGERTMYAYRGANAALAPEHVPPTALDGVRALHLSGYALLAGPQRYAAERAAAEAVRRRIPVTLDVPVAAAERAGAAILAMLPAVAVTMVGEPEARTLTGRSDTAGAIADLAARTGGHLASSPATPGPR